MSPLEAAKLFREKADLYLEMTSHVCDERQRQILHELFEENEAKAELLARMHMSEDQYSPRTAFRIQ
jgi:queuine/archaeosine tRNA-ribosyltransferase